MTDDFINYLHIARYISGHRNDIKGAYNSVWENGGESRIFSNETQSFEAVVSQFVVLWREAETGKKR